MPFSVFCLLPYYCILLFYLLQLLSFSAAASPAVTSLHPLPLRSSLLHNGKYRAVLSAKVFWTVFASACLWVSQFSCMHSVCSCFCFSPAPCCNFIFNRLYISVMHTGTALVRHLSISWPVFCSNVPSAHAGLLILITVSECGWK